MGLRGASLLCVSVLLNSSILVRAQNANEPHSPTQPASTTAQPSTPGPPVATNAPHMSRQTRLDIIRDFETQIVYARTAFPMGTKGLVLRNGATTPDGPDLQALLSLWGPAVRPGDPAHISFVQIKDDHIHFDLNGGAVHRKKWYEHIEVAGANGNGVPLSNGATQQNPHGSYLDIYFDKYVPEMTDQQLRTLLFPVLDFNAHNKEEAYLNTMQPKVKEAILAHHVLVGMDTEMVVHAMGKAPKKVREKDKENGTDYEEWIYGEPPHDVDFVRIIGSEVVRVETMKVGGEKIVRTEREVILEKPDQDTEAKKEQEERPANAPSLRRPGEDQENAPKPADGASPVPIAQPPTIPQPSGPGSLIAEGTL